MVLAHTNLKDTYLWNEFKEEKVLTAELGNIQLFFSFH
jgi:hypothetical protein